MELDGFIDRLGTLVVEYAWMLQAFGVVLGTLVIGTILRRTLLRLLKHARDTDTMLDDALLGALIGPARGLVWLVGIAFAAHIVGKQTDAAIFDAVGPLRDVGIVGMIAWFLVRLVSAYERRHIERKSREGAAVDRTFISAVSKLVRAAIIITAVLIVLQTLGINIAGVLAFGGVGGIAIGLAARDLLANLFGGLTIYLDRPFAVGDWIRSPDREIEGTVEEIGWRRTMIRTFDKRPLYVPNAAFTTIAVENPSRMSHRRILETVGVRYDDVGRLPAILADVRKYLRENPDIDASQTLMVNLNEFGPSSMDFFVYTFTKTTVWTEYHAVKEKVMLAIAAIIEKHGGEIAYPTTTVHVADEIRLLEQTQDAVGA